MEFGAEEGSLVEAASEVDAWVVEKRVWCSGVDGKGMTKRERPADDVRFEQNGSVARAERGKKGGFRGRRRMEGGKRGRERGPWV
jgi:hypothetical protein